jgi:hypothetical protein
MLRKMAEKAIYSTSMKISSPQWFVLKLARIILNYAENALNDLIIHFYLS